MFTLNDDLSIYATRGDIVFFSVSAQEDGKPYKFQAGDVLRMKVYGKKDAEVVVLQKDFPVLDVAEEVEIFLTEEDTKIGEVISKPKDYWYEVELNPGDNPQTIIGYDEDGAKVFKLFPEGDDIGEYVPDPEDFPVVDEELDMASPRPVANSAVAKAFANLEAGYEATHKAVAEMFVTPEMYGAIGDGKADDSEAFQAAVNTGKRVDLGAKTYVLRNTVNLPVGSQIVGTKNSIIHAYAPTVFHISEKNTISGFTIRVQSADVLNVFEADDNSGGWNMAGDGALLYTTISNMTVHNDLTVAPPDLYTVCHFHVTSNSLYGITVRDCVFVNNITGGYAVRAYSDGNGWVSTCAFVNVNTSSFTWHYFFANNDTELVNTSGGLHTLNGCVGQCSPATNGFTFANSIYGAKIINCTPWDWGSSSTGSIKCKGTPYVFNKAYEGMLNGAYTNDININAMIFYDGKDFTATTFRHDHNIRLGGLYSHLLIPKYIGIPMKPCVKLLDRPNTTASHRIRFYLCDSYGITYVSIIPSTGKVYTSKPLLSTIAFGLSADGKSVYMYNPSGNIASNTGIMTIPVSNSMVRYGEGNAHNIDLTPTAWIMDDTYLLDAVPGGVVELAKVLAQPSYVTDADGTVYSLSVVTGADGTKQLSIDRAYGGTKEV